MLELDGSLSLVRKQNTNTGRNFLFPRDFLQKSSWPLENNLMSLTSEALSAVLHCFWILQGVGSERRWVPTEPEGSVCAQCRSADACNWGIGDLLERVQDVLELLKYWPLSNRFRVVRVWERNTSLTPFTVLQLSTRKPKTASCGVLNCNMFRNKPWSDILYSYRKLFSGVCHVNTKPQTPCSWRFPVSENFKSALTPKTPSKNAYISSQKTIACF